MQTPKNRDELIEALSNELWDIRDTDGIEARRIILRTIIEGIEALGVRLVPTELTDEMSQAVFRAVRTIEAEYCAAIAASPYAPSNKEGNE